MIWLFRLFELPLGSLLLCIATIGAIAALRSRCATALAGAAAEASPGISGGEAAVELLAAAGLDGVDVVRGARRAGGFDRAHRVIRLPASVYDGRTWAHVTLAAHEFGHALQHVRRDAPQPLALRDAARFGSRLGPPTAALLFGVGFVLDIPPLTNAGLLSVPAAAVMPLLVRPLERDASRRARRALAMTGLVDSAREAPLSVALAAATWSDVGAALPRARGDRRNTGGVRPFPLSRRRGHG